MISHCRLFLYSFEILCGWIQKNDKNGFKAVTNVIGTFFKQLLKLIRMKKNYRHGNGTIRREHSIVSAKK